MAKEKNENESNCNLMSDYYDGKSVLITGASGYLGTVLLEVLLRCLPGISIIYLLLRPKKDIEPENRKEIIFKKWIFRELLEQNPKVVDKVHVIPGNVAQPNFGMSDEHFEMITKNVSAVFHIAAVTSFFKELKKISIENSLAVKYLIETCRKMPKLEALVYTSTAYSNCNRKAETEERIYSLPYKAEKFLDALENGAEKEFEELVSKCSPKWPNSYTFSKCLAENVLNEMASDLPVVIVRPSVIVATWRGPLPGYVEEGSGIVNLTVAVGKGFIRTMYCKLGCCLDMIPADIVANTHVVAAWSVATRSTTSPFVVNCTAGHVWKVNFKDYVETLFELVKRNMLPKSFQEPNITMLQSKLLYRIHVIYEHFIPACVVDTYMFIKGRKFRMMPLYNLLDRVMDQMHHFMENMFIFKVDHFNSLTEQLDPRDKKVFYMDLEDLNFKQMTKNLPNSEFYDWNKDDKSVERRKETIMIRTMILTAWRRFAVIVFCYLLYLVYKQLRNAADSIF